MQAVPQSIAGEPGAVDATLPVPAPAFATDSAKLPGGENAATTLLAWFIVTTQLPTPLQAPDQPANVELPVADALKVTTLLAATAAEHVAPQSMSPAGVIEIILPLPAPVFETFSAYVVSEKLAPRSRAPFIVTTQLPVPLQAPDHPVNVEPGAALAESVTTVPAFRLAAHVAPQSMTPAGVVDATVPAPAPDRDTPRT